MAHDTPKTLRNCVIYSVFVRNYSTEGTLAALESDLDRIRDLGVDIIWLMPIQPTGKEHRKGSLGSPYSIRDYRSVDPDLGTMEDFIRLTERIHDRGMRCILDVVYNHTAHDSVLRREHPEWFFHRADGNFGNRIGDWWDVIDLDYRNRELWDYQIDTLKFWARYVDGFRCDVAPLVDLEFWLRARDEVATVRPGAIWLAESVEPGFVEFCRKVGINASDDTALYRAFDMCYDYDIFPDYLDRLTGKITAQDYADAINHQEELYPDNYVKARFLENHDKPRAAFLIRDARSLRSWTAFQYFQKGAALLYAGQEKGCMHLPSLFDRDTVTWQNDDDPTLDLTPLMQRLHQIKQDNIFAQGRYRVTALSEDVLAAAYTRPNEEKPAIVGIFSLRGQSALLRVSQLGIPDGTYTDLLTGSAVEVTMGLLSTAGEPLLFRI